MSHNNCVENVKTMYESTVKERQNSSWWLRTVRGSRSSVGARVHYQIPISICLEIPVPQDGSSAAQGHVPYFSGTLAETRPHAASVGPTKEAGLGLGAWD